MQKKTIAVFLKLQKILHSFIHLLVGKGIGMKAGQALQ